MKIAYPKVKSYFFTFSGLLYVWFILGSFFGDLMIETYPRGYREEGCYPTGTVFGVFEFYCRDPIDQFFWYVFIGTPRLLAVVLDMPFRLISLYLDSENTDYLIEALYWLPYSIPIYLFILIPGFIYWCHESRMMTSILTPLLIIVFFLQI